MLTLHRWTHGTDGYSTGFISNVGREMTKTTNKATPNRTKLKLGSDRLLYDTTVCI